MTSLAPECAELKTAYDTCFNKWYSEKFLKGDVSQDCEDVFRLYKACLSVESIPCSISVLIEKNTKSYHRKH